VLNAASDVTALVSSRVYVGHAPQAASLPYIVTTLMSSNELPVLNGSTGSRVLSYDIDCVATRSVTAEAVGGAVRSSLAGYSGTVNDDTIHTITIESESSDYDPPKSGDDVGIHTATIAVVVQYKPN
tara:strand:+ start:223 stop:603 length:381 start_codon:yes stop_codon:yes gene_type:complete